MQDSDINSTELSFFYYLEMFSSPVDVFYSIWIIKTTKYTRTSFIYNKNIYIYKKRHTSISTIYNKNSVNGQSFHTKSN